MLGKTHFRLKKCKTAQKFLWKKCYDFQLFIQFFEKEAVGWKEYDNLLGWRFFMSPYRDQEWMVNVPLPLVQEWVRAADQST